MHADTLARIRIAVFAMAGLTCAAYSALALIGNTPQPFSPWLPGAAGLLAGAVMWASSIAAGRRSAGIAHDELYQREWGQAVRFSYWFAIALYPLFGILLAAGVVTPTTSFAAMGTATGAAPLLMFCILTLRS